VSPRQEETRRVHAVPVLDLGVVQAVRISGHSGHGWGGLSWIGLRAVMRKVRAMI
jgi:hypothetical protein